MYLPSNSRTKTDNNLIENIWHSSGCGPPYDSSTWKVRCAVSEVRQSPGQPIPKKCGSIIASSTAHAPPPPSSVCTGAAKGGQIALQLHCEDKRTPPCAQVGSLRPHHRRQISTRQSGVVARLLGGVRRSGGSAVAAVPERWLRSAWAQDHAPVRCPRPPPRTAPSRQDALRAARPCRSWPAWRGAGLRRGRASCRAWWHRRPG